MGHALTRVAPFPSFLAVTVLLSELIEMTFELETVAIVISVLRGNGQKLLVGL